MDDILYKFKEKLLQSGIFRHQTGNEYTCDCPFCGDRKRHCYVLIKMSDDTPVLYNCFKCTAKGVVGKKFLEYFNMEDLQIPKYQTSKKLDVNSTVTVKTLGDTVKEEDDISNVCEYINERVSHYPTINELKAFQYIGNPKLYASEYLGYVGNNDPFRNRNWFKLTNANIIGRWYNDDSAIRWLRFKSNKVKDTGMYSMKIPFDILKPINVCIAEGIMDVIGLYYNYPIENSIYIATMGKNYERGIHHILNRGIFGESVNIKIFKDTDVDNVYINKNLRSLFKRVDVYENTKAKDFGVPQDMLEIKKVVK